MCNPPEATRHHDLIILLILLPLRAIYFRTFQCEIPCTRQHSQVPNTYAGSSNNPTLSVYFFPRKILPHAFISPVLDSTMTALCVYQFWENTLPCALISYGTIIRYFIVNEYSHLFRFLLKQISRVDFFMKIVSKV